MPSTTFDVHKKQVLDRLYKPDRSKKGTVDERLIPFIDTINDSDDFYTTSSCSGRIVLFTDNNGERKDTADWLFVSHDTVTYDELRPAFEKLPVSLVLFRFEGFILHVCCRTFEDAKHFMVLAQNNGYKHTGILAATKRFVVQVMGVQRFDVPIAEDRTLLVSEEYIRILIDMANDKLAKTHKEIDRLQLAFEKQLANKTYTST